MDNYINNTQSQLPDYQFSNSPINESECISISKGAKSVKAKIYKATTPKPSGNIYLINDEHYHSNIEHHNYLINCYSQKGFNVANTTKYLKPEIVSSLITLNSTKSNSALKNTLMVTSISGFVNMIPYIPQSIYSSIVLLLTRNDQQFNPSLNYSSSVSWIKSIKCPLYTLNNLPYNTSTSHMRSINSFINYLHNASSSEIKIKITINNSYDKSIEELYHNDISSILQLL